MLHATYLRVTIGTVEFGDSFLDYKDPHEIRREKLLAQSSLTINDACSLLRVSRWTVMRWITEGRLSGEKVGRAKLIPTAQVKRLLEDRGYQAESTRRGRFTSMSEPQVRQVTIVLAEVLAEGLMPVLPEELAEVVRGHEHAGPVFWSSLVAGIERLKWKALPSLLPMR